MNSLSKRSKEDWKYIHTMPSLWWEQGKVKVIAGKVTETNDFNANNISLIESKKETIDRHVCM